jgi:hypothetical protein
MQVAIWALAQDRLIVESQQPTDNTAQTDRSCDPGTHPAVQGCHSLEISLLGALGGAIKVGTLQSRARLPERANRRLVFLQALGGQSLYGDSNASITSAELYIDSSG